ncbi:ABC transporter substrate-binding protein [Paenibacillus taichungensis]|uniref:ABC transporter substrate-binding protein n=1 Tax=Paenibacillus taichungensis TaxID=484184 RepID=UPI0039A63436
MKKKLGLWLTMICMLAVLGACGNKEDVSGNAENSSSTGTTATNNETDTAEAAEGTRTIKYLDQEYTVPTEVNRIVITGSMEAMEDALVLDVHPVGAITFGGEFPEMYASITDQAESIGQKIEPNFETILSLKPDIILGSTKFKPEVAEQLSKIAPFIQVSHIATDWESNLNLLAELTGKQEQAKQEIEQYKAALTTAQAELGDKLENKKVLAVRIRNGQMYVYPESVFVNPILYGDLGFQVPAEIQAAKAQEALSVEKFAEMNPDYVFVQFETSENSDTPNALTDLQNNPIIQKTTALKENHAFVNVIDPLAEGGPAWSRIEFLKAAVEQLSK